MGETSKMDKYYGNWDKVESISDVFENILSRVPMKALLTFKSVSKHWYRVISSRQLAKLQLIQSKEHPKYILFPGHCYGGTDAYLINEGGEIDKVISLRFIENIRAPKMICSYNGLICCIDNAPSDVYDLEIRVCNPATREVLLLPKASQSKILPQVGVFFGPEENEYKIFRFFCNPRCGYSCFEWEVYNSKTGSWRHIGELPFCPMVNSFHPLSPDQVYVGGLLYWFLLVEEADSCTVFILAVDEDANFTKISLPSKIPVWLVLIDLEGSLGLVAVDESMVVDIWVLLNHENSSWCLRARTEFCVGEVDILDSAAARKNEIFFIVRDLSDFRHFLVYNLATETWRELNFGDTFRDLCPVVFPFTTSILPCSRPLE